MLRSQDSHSVVIFFRWSWALVLEVVGIILVGMILELGITHLVAPSHHLSVHDSIIWSWESHRQVITLGIEAVIGGRSPLHERGFKVRLSFEFDNPVITYGLIKTMVMHMLLLRHVNAGHFVLISTHINKGIS